MKRKSTLLGMATLAMLLGLTANAYAVGIKAAVIAGVAKYKNINSLSYCAKDAVDVYNKAMWYGMPKSNIKLLTDSKATKRGIQSAIKSAANKVYAGDVFLFFFSGHGTYGPDVYPFGDADGDDEYICPYDSAYLGGGGINYASMIRDDELYDWLLPITLKGAKVLVVLDSCYSGGAIKTTVSFGGKEQEVSIKTLEGTPPRKALSTSGFTKDLNAPGFIVMTASNDNQTSQEWAWFQNGVFTYLLLGALNGVADDSWTIGSIGNDDGAVSANELYYCATNAQNVPYHNSLTITQHFNQTPQIYGGDNTTLFYLK